MGSKRIILWLGILCLLGCGFNASAASDPNIITAAVRPDSPGSTYGDPVVVNGGLKEGCLPYVDREYFMGAVGDFNGLDYVMCSMTGRDSSSENTWYDVTVDKSGRLFLIIDNRVGDSDAGDPPTLGEGKMDWVVSDGFVPTNYVIPGGVGSGEACTVYQKAVTAGTYTLKEQNDTDSRAQYMIAAIPDTMSLPNTTPFIQGVRSAYLLSPGESLVIDATVTDDGIPATPTVAWTIESQPEGTTVTFDPGVTSEDVTIDFSDLGDYQLKFAASDSNLITEILVDVSVSYPAFAVDTDDWAEASNDTDKGPDATKSGDTTFARNYTNEEGTTTRRKITYYSWDISSIKAAGETLFESHLAMNFKSLSSNTKLYVYGVVEDQDNVGTIKGNLTWNTAPGLIPGLPLSTLIDESVLDRPDIVLLMDYVVSDYNPVSRAWMNFPDTPALDEFLNADTDDNVMMMFVTLQEGKSFEICAPSTKGISYSGGEYEAATGEGLAGVIIEGSRTVATWATNPIPQIHSTQSVAMDELSWTNPAGENLMCYVYFAADGTDPYDTTPIVTSGNSISLSSEGISIDADTTYNWIVDVNDLDAGTSRSGYMWSFYVGNGYPVIEVDNMYLWLNNSGDPASATAVVSATVTDDGLVNPTPALIWEQIDGPATVTIDPNNADNFTVDLPATGTYTFKLTADDGELVSTATTEIFVGETPCDAAQAKPDYEANVADLNGNCYVDMTDFATFASNWLICNPSMDAACAE